LVNVHLLTARAGLVVHIICDWVGYHANLWHGTWCWPLKNWLEYVSTGHILLRNDDNPGIHLLIIQKIDLDPMLTTYVLGLKVIGVSFPKSQFICEKNILLHFVMWNIFYTLYIQCVHIYIFAPSMNVEWPY